MNEDKTIPAWAEVEDTQEDATGAASEATEEAEEQEEALDDDAILKALQNPSEAVKKYLNDAVRAAVKKALAGATPKRSTVKVDPITKEDFNKMTYSQRKHLFETNRPLYEKLKGAM